MLILTRRIGERLIIDDEIVVGVLGVMGNQVRMNVDSPKNWWIYRKDIADRIEAGEGLSPNGESASERGNLVLTRKIGEVICMGTEDKVVIEITILGIKGNQVRIGVEAPKDMAVHRESIWERIQKEKNPNWENPFRLAA